MFSSNRAPAGGAGRRDEEAGCETFDDLVALFDGHASMADTVQQRFIKIDNKPERAKSFRKLPTREAADRLGISDSYLRRLVIDEPGVAERRK